MKLEFFIAQRIIQAKGYKSNTSSVIIKIAIFAIAISIFMMLISISTGIGLQNKIREKLATFNGHISVSNFDNNQSPVTIEPIEFSDKVKAQLKNNEQIKHVQNVATKAGLIRTAKAFEGIVFKGVDQNYDFKAFQEYLIKGKIPNLNEKFSMEIMLSNKLAQKLNLKIGDKFNTFFMKESNTPPSVRKFKLVGIFDTGYLDFDNTYVLGALSHIQKINKWNKNQVGAVEIFIDDFDNLEEVTNQVYKNIPPNFNASSVMDKNTSIFEWIKLFDFNILLIIIIMIGIATINMSVALLVLILEKTQMIGVLKALGADNILIQRVFIYQAIYLTLRGMVWGNLTALILMSIQKYFHVIKLNAESYYVNYAPIDINPIYIIGVNILTVLIVFVVLIVPSIIISKITPVKAIRYS